MRYLLQEFPVEIYFVSETRLNSFFFFHLLTFVTLTLDFKSFIFMQALPGNLMKLATYSIQHSTLSPSVGGGDKGKTKSVVGNKAIRKESSQVRHGSFMGSSTHSSQRHYPLRTDCGHRIKLFIWT